MVPTNLEKKMVVCSMVLRRLLALGVSARMLSCTVRMNCRRKSDGKVVMSAKQ